MSLNKWDHRFMSLAHLVASWSKDPSSLVGCAIADAHNRVVSLGFNGPPRGVADGFTSREQRLRRTLHAEKNAITFARQDLTGCTIYVTHPPCAGCAAYIIQNGIRKVVAPAGSPEFAARWAEDMAEAALMFAEAEVEVEVYSPCP